MFLPTYKQKSLQAFEATLAANYSTVPSEGWCYRLFRKKYFFVLKILTYCTTLWGSRLWNLTFAWLQDLQYIAICHFLGRNPSPVPTLTCQEAELCTAPAIPKVRGEFVSKYVGFINYLKIKCSNIYYNAYIIYPGTDLLPCLEVNPLKINTSTFHSHRWGWGSSWRDPTPDGTGLFHVRVRGFDLSNENSKPCVCFILWTLQG